MQAPELWARWLIGPIESLSTMLRPLVIALTWITSGILRAFGGEIKRRGPFYTEDELRLLVEVGEEQGVLEEDERDMIHNVFDLADTAVREIMVPRIDMVTAKISDSVQTATQLIIQGGQSRIPIYDDASADIMGVLYAKDLLRVLATQAPDAPRPQTVRDLPLREPYFVPESKRLDDLLHEMQRQQIHIAIVVDEYGAVAGLVTIEDLVEEIIGDIKDEYDKEEQLFEQVGPNEYIVDAKISLDEFNELTEEELTSDEYDTLGGLVYAQLDKIPTVGDTVTYGNITLTVLGTKGRRITKVKVVRGAPGAQAPTPPTPAPTPPRAGRDERHDDQDGRADRSGQPDEVDQRARDRHSDEHIADERDGVASVSAETLPPFATASRSAVPHSAPLAPTGAVGAASMAISALAEAAAPATHVIAHADHVDAVRTARNTAPGAERDARSATTRPLPPARTPLAATPHTNGVGATGTRPTSNGNRSGSQSATPQGRGQPNGGAPQRGGDGRRRSGDRPPGGQRQPPQGQQPPHAQQTPATRVGQPTRAAAPSRPQGQPHAGQSPSSQPQRAPVGAQIVREGAERPRPSAPSAQANPPNPANGRVRPQAAAKPGRPPNAETPTTAS